MATEPVWISLTGVTATGFHGVLEDERATGQQFVVDLRIESEVDLAADDLAGTVNYAEVADRVVAQITGGPVQLIETLAGRIADDVCQLSNVRTVEVVVHKPQAPIAVPFTDVAVTVIRSQS
ncbi:dihydroneopterin aldolase [Aestuariimicrobium sp. p3-SID1156]|uniref:dihydroneopterin aldolase n=1 Tax=Aestuariimicrobium sp. p3-SID1156 TaxID=2916038 RepID=UPI00223C183F|nr:dihydroneopterin aldolase [Aestuariimicrobium sp. p3-SID1156]MCT1458597.1 dihydroneopterin aldolase [Aestuariimicrobium sp. p3-SID1156]